MASSMHVCRCLPCQYEFDLLTKSCTQTESTTNVAADAQAAVCVILPPVAHEVAQRRITSQMLCANR